MTVNSLTLTVARTFYRGVEQPGSSSGSETSELGELLSSTKAKGDIAEQAVALECLKLGWEVLKPIGDKKSYDLVADVEGVLVKLQVKAAWYSSSTRNYVVDNRRTKTNRRQMVRSNYSVNDFDFAVVYIAESEVFYVFPVNEFIAYGSEIHLVEDDKRQRKPKSANFRGAWNLIPSWAARRETDVRSPVKVGEAVCGVIPSQVPEVFSGKGVETLWQAS